MRVENLGTSFLLCGSIPGTLVPLPVVMETGVMVVEMAVEMVVATVAEVMEEAEESDLL